MTHEEAALVCLREFALFNPHGSPAWEGGIIDGDHIWINMPRARTGMSRGPSRSEVGGSVCIPGTRV